MAVFADYVDLRRAVLLLVGRTDITDVFDRLTSMAEHKFNREFRVGQMMDTATVTSMGGSADLPADIAELIGVHDSAGNEMTGAALQYVRGGAGDSFYAVSDGKVLTSASGDLTVDYYGKIPSLVTSNTNWLLEDYPGVYLYGVAEEAAKYTRDIDAAKEFAVLADAESQALSADDQRKRFGRARVRVAGVTP